MKRLMIISTTVAFCGGMATMMAASSCDPECVEDRRTSVVLHLTAEDGWDPVRNPAHVSYAVYPESGARGPSTDFEKDLGQVPTLRGARCMDMGCTEYALGFDEPGTYEITVEICGKTFETTAHVEVSDDLCHVEAIDVELPVSAKDCRPDDDDGEAPDEMRPFDTCDLVAHPSVYAVVGKTQGDVFMPVPVDRVWYTVQDRKDLNMGELPIPVPGPDDEVRDPPVDPEDCEKDDRDRYDDKGDDDEDDDDPKGGDEPGEEPTLEQFDAMCVDDPSQPGTCTAWLAGFERTGWFTVGFEYCGVEVTKEVWVGKPKDACHVDTQFMMLEAETLECLTTPTKDPDDEPKVPQVEFG